MYNEYRTNDPKVDTGLEVVLPARGTEGLIPHDPSEAEPKYAYDPNGRSQPSGARTGSRNPFGLAPWLFGLLVSLITAVVVGGAVGGGLGAALASKKNSDTTCTPSTSSSNTTTPTTSNNTASSVNLNNYTVAVPSSVAELNWSCPQSNNTVYSTYEAQNFNLKCGINWESNSAGIVDNSGNKLWDILTFVAYTLEDCINACSDYNLAVFVNNHNSTVCRGVSFSRNLNAHAGANCGLKSARMSNSSTPVFDVDAVTADCTNCP